MDHSRELERRSFPIGNSDHSITKVQCDIQDSLAVAHVKDRTSLKGSTRKLYFTMDENNISEKQENASNCNFDIQSILPLHFRSAALFQLCHKVAERAVSVYPTRERGTRGTRGKWPYRPASTIKTAMEWALLAASEAATVSKQPRRSNLTS